MAIPLNTHNARGIRVPYSFSSLAFRSEKLLRSFSISEPPKSYDRNCIETIRYQWNVILIAGYIDPVIVKNLTTLKKKINNNYLIFQYDIFLFYI